MWLILIIDLFCTFYRWKTLIPVFIFKMIFCFGHMSIIFSSLEILLNERICIEGRMLKGEYRRRERENKRERWRRGGKRKAGKEETLQKNPSHSPLRGPFKDYSLGREEERIFLRDYPFKEIPFKGGGRKEYPSREYCVFPSKITPLKGRKKAYSLRNYPFKGSL